MSDLLKSVDSWFLVLVVIALGGWFVWSVKNIFDGFTRTVGDLQKLIDKLFDKHDDHESRLSELEGHCKAMHGGPDTGGRRFYDPPERLSRS